MHFADYWTINDQKKNHWKLKFPLADHMPPQRYCRYLMPWYRKVFQHPVRRSSEPGQTGRGSEGQEHCCYSLRWSEIKITYLIRSQKKKLTVLKDKKNDIDLTQKLIYILFTPAHIQLKLVKLSLITEVTNLADPAEGWEQLPTQP